MRREIEMPRLSEAVEEGVLVAWLVEPGATVGEGDLVAEVQVEKASAEVRAPAAGRMGSLLVGAGDVVAQGAPIAVLETEVAAAAAESVERPAPVTAAGVAAPSMATGEVIASPAAKRLARERGIDLRSVAGSGPGGRIVESDILGAADATAAGAVTAPRGERAPGAEPAQGAGSVPDGAIEPLSTMRRTIADRLRTGLASTAQLTVTAEADVTDLEASLAGLPADEGRHASFTEAIVRACALALREHPRVAARWTERGLVPAERIGIGVAVALDDGLIAPVVRDADRKDIPTLRREIADLADRARHGTLAPADTEGACFSVTNLGAYRIDAFTPLLNPPQTAILGVGRARRRPAVVDGVVAPRMLVVLSLTFDHQVVDGAPAAAFLEAIVRRLERPPQLLAEG